jgi:very-short-patch-repair endonuclease
MKRKTHKEFVDEIKIIHPELTILGLYINSSTKILVRDEFGIEYLLKPLGLVQGKKPTIQSAVNKTEAFKIKLKAINTNLKVLSEYTTSENKILVEDGIGIKYEIIANDLLRGISPSINSAVDKNEAFKIKAQLIHGDKYEYSDSIYNGKNNQISIFCNSCSESFTTKPDIHFQGKGCPSCGLQKVRDKNQKIVKERALTVESDVFLKHNGRVSCDKLEYKGNKVKSLFGCNVNEEHGYWLTTPNDILRGFGCPICNASKGENKISEILDSLNINYSRQKTFDGCKHKNLLRFDFYLPEHNMCIEYDGRQHFEPVDIFGGEDEFLKTKNRDKIKTNFCLDNNIKLVRIPHTDKENIEGIIKRSIVF